MPITYPFGWLLGELDQNCTEVCQDHGRSCTDGDWAVSSRTHLHTALNEAADEHQTFTGASECTDPAVGISYNPASPYIKWVLANGELVRECYYQNSVPDDVGPISLADGTMIQIGAKTSVCDAAAPRSTAGGAGDLMNHSQRLCKCDPAECYAFVGEEPFLDTCSACVAPPLPPDQSHPYARCTSGTCATGYTFNTDAAENIVCCGGNPVGQFRTLGDPDRIGSCTIQTCDVSEVTAPTNGQFGTNCAEDSLTINHGTSCDLTCNTGYTLSGQPTCSEGTLSSSTATCTECTRQIGCITNGSFFLWGQSGFQMGNACSDVDGLFDKLICDNAGGAAGYYVDTQGTATSCEVGTWSDAGETSTSECQACTRQDGCSTNGSTCSDVDGLYDKLICSPASGAAGYYVDTQGTATICAVDTYSEAGEDSTTGCDACASGTSSDGTATCSPNSCSKPTTPVVGYDLSTMQCSSLTTPIVCETGPTCVTGYTGNPTNEDYSCDTDGTDLTLGGCSPNSCSIPTTPVVGYDLSTMRCSSLTTPIVCETGPTCVTGYTGTPMNDDYSCITHESELTIGGCTIQTCDVSEVTAPTNGQFGTNCAEDSTTINHGTSCDLTCDTGYTLSGQPTCTGEALSSTTATCTIQTCVVSAVTAPTNGQFGTNCAGWSSTTINHGETCDLTCDENFILIDQPSCTETKLSSSTAVCISDQHCIKPISLNYIDNNHSSVLFNDINSETIRNNLKCSPNTYTKGERYLVSLAKLTDNFYNDADGFDSVKIYIKRINGIPKIIDNVTEKYGGMFYKVKIPENINENDYFSTVLPILLIENEGFIDNNIPEYNFVRHVELFPEQLYKIELINGPIVICNNPQTYYELDGCTSERNTCNDWVNEADNDLVRRETDTEIYCNTNDNLIDLSRVINNYSELRGYNETLQELCCNERVCSAYNCPENYIQNDENNNEPIYNDSGIPIPLQKCCIRKTCDDWKQEGNGCGEAEFITDKLGFSKNECCFELCESWNKRTITDNIIARFPNISEEDITNIFDSNNVSSWSTGDYLDKLSNIDNIIDNGSPVILTNCYEGDLLISEKQGDDVLHCCANKNTCISKEWECPTNMFAENDSFFESCYIDNIQDVCPETSENIELCCSEDEKCSDLNCPINYTNKISEKDNFCKGNVCNIQDDMNCCVEKDNCSNLYCGYGYDEKPNRENYNCSGESCNLENDRDTCCIKNEKCMDMTCPLGYYNKPTNLDKLCNSGSCKSSNKLDMLKCCKECPKIQNAKTSICNSGDKSIVLKCEDGFVIEGGLCVKQLGVYDITLTLDGDYEDFIGSENADTKMKNVICDLLKDKISKEECLDLLSINEYNPGSIIMNIKLRELEGVDITEENLDNIFSKGTFIEELNMNIKEKPIIKNNPVESSELLKCYGSLYKHECQYGMKLKANAFQIYGNSDDKCCEVDWDIFKIIGPLILFCFIFILIFFKETLGSIN